MSKQEFKPYVCKLDAATLKKAQDELKEDPKNRQGAIDTFRQWIQQQKHMKCPLDDVFLLAFLRRYHFSQLESRKALEFYMTTRENFSDWMKNLDTTSAEVDKVLDHGLYFYLGRDEEERQLILFRPGFVDSSHAKTRLGCGRACTAMMTYMHFANEDAQVHGLCYIGDYNKQTIANEMSIPLAEKKRYFTYVKTFPTRMKGLHMINSGPVMEIVFPLFVSFLDEKLRKRFHCHTSLESMYKDIPMKLLPLEYLPDDYTGPNAGTEKEIIAKTKAFFQSPAFRDRVKYLSSEEFYIKMEDKDTDVPTASFRKLNVD